MRRDCKVRPAMTKGLSIGKKLSAADKVDDLHAVTVVNEGVFECGALEDHQIVLNGYTAGVDRQPREQLRHGERLIQPIGFAVERNKHGRGRRLQWERTARDSGKSR